MASGTAGLGLSWVDGYPPLPRAAFSYQVQAGSGDGLSVAMVVTVTASPDMLRASPNDNKVPNASKRTTFKRSGS